MDGVHHKFLKTFCTNKKNLEEFQKVKLLNCVGGESSILVLEWIYAYNKKQVEFIGIEAGGPKKK